jgi:Mce-associated membrane protein
VPDDTPASPPRRPAPAASATAEPARGGTVTEVEEAPATGSSAASESSVAPEAGSAAESGARAPRRSLVPVLAALLVLLLAGCVVLWAARPGDSAVRTDAYVGALQAARAGIVDVASFDHVTIDDDIEQIRNVTTGDLRQESVDQLDQRRQQITDAQAVVDTTVVGAAVGDADEDSATVFAVIQSTQQTNASEQAQVQRYRVEISLQRVDGRWLLSGITGR